MELSATPLSDTFVSLFTSPIKLFKSDPRQQKGELTWRGGGEAHDIDSWCWDWDTVLQSRGGEEEAIDVLQGSKNLTMRHWEVMSEA